VSSNAPRTSRRTASQREDEEYRRLEELGVYQRVQAILRRCAGDWSPADREDMAQDAMCRVIKAMRRAQIDWARFNPWLSTVVEHVVTDSWRARRGRLGTRQEVALREADDLEDEQMTQEVQTLIARVTVEAALESAGLTDVERVIVEHKYWYELSTAEIAEVLGMAPSSVSRYLQRALRQLRRCLQEG